MGVVVGTPGRVYDLLKRYILKADSIKSLVLDEADEMLSRGFKEQMYDIFQYLPTSMRIALFSATIPYDVLFNKIFDTKLLLWFLNEKEEFLLEVSGLIILFNFINLNQWSYP